MTDNEIIKALELILDDDKDCFRECIFPKDMNVPCEKDGQCFIKIKEETLDLIKRQQAEIDRLKMLFNDQQEIIADLEWTVENEGFKHLGKMYSELRAEAIKEFAEKLNSGFFRDHIYNGSYVLGLIEAIAKGMAGEGNDNI